MMQVLNVIKGTRPFKKPYTHLSHVSHFTPPITGLHPIVRVTAAILKKKKGKPIKKRKEKRGEVLTAEQLHPGARLVHGGGVAEEEKRHAGDAAQDKHHGQQHEEKGGLEGA